MKQEFIRTTYKQNKNSEEKEQYWLTYLNDRNFLTVNNLANFVGGYKTYPIIDYMKKLDEMTTRNIIFLPVTVPDEKAKFSREFHRGSEWDENPMVYRKNSIPEVKYENGYFQSYFSYNGITDGVRGQLNMWFKSQLDEHCTKELLKYLIEQERKDFFNRLKKQFQEHLEETKTMLNYIEKVISDIE